MDSTALLPLPDNTVIPFDKYTEPKRIKHIYKIYNDGSHYVATIGFHASRRMLRKPQDLRIVLERDENDIVLDSARSSVEQLCMYKQEKELSAVSGNSSISQSENAIRSAEILSMKRKQYRNIWLGKVRSGAIGVFPHKPLKRNFFDEFFNSLFLQAVQNGLKILRKNKTEFVKYILPFMRKAFPDYAGLYLVLPKKVETHMRNYFARVKRFKRKAYLNKWNYFVTFTYDDERFDCDESKFVKKFCRLLSNLKSRHGWKCLGRFERAPETGRLHFHGLVYVPDGEMVGTITEKQDYSLKKHEMQVRHENDYFVKRLGVNDFQELSALQLKLGNTLEYILKYMGKSDERTYCSRGVPTEIYKDLDVSDIAGEILDFVIKFLVFDDSIDWERDILNYRNVEIDLSESPPLAA